MKILLQVFLLSIAVQSLAQSKGLALIPPQQPALFEAIRINTSLGERDFALSPDGNEIFYTLQSPGRNFQTILHTRKQGNSWSKPVVARFAGQFTDLEPAFAPDGNRLFFVSNRPLSGSQPKDFDIWYIEKKGGTWGEPKNVGTPVNTSADEFYPSCSKQGNLYYTAAYENGVGREDIYMSSWHNGSYQQPVALDTAVNSTAYEFNAYISPGEEFIIFSSQGRKDEKGRGDLYISIKSKEGKWTAAKNLRALNSDRIDYCPFVTYDQKILFFTSERHTLPGHFDKPVTYNSLIESYSSVLNGGGNIYWVNFENLLKSIQ